MRRLHLLKTHCWKSAPCDVTRETNSWELYRIYYYSVTNCAILVHLDNYMRIGSTGPWVRYEDIIFSWLCFKELMSLFSPLWPHTAEIKDVFMCSKHHLLLSTLVAVTSKLVINQAIRPHLFLSLSTKLAFWSIVTHNNTDRLTDRSKKRSRRMKKDIYVEMEALINCNWWHLKFVFRKTWGIINKVALNCVACSKPLIDFWNGVEQKCEIAQIWLSKELWYLCKIFKWWEVESISFLCGVTKSSLSVLSGTCFWTKHKLRMMQA